MGLDQFQWCYRAAIKLKKHSRDITQQTAGPPDPRHGHQFAQQHVLYNGADGGESLWHNLVDKHSTVPSNPSLPYLTPYPPTPYHPAPPNPDFTSFTQCTSLVCRYVYVHTVWTPAQIPPVHNRPVRSPYPPDRGRVCPPSLHPSYSPSGRVAAL